LPKYFPGLTRANDITLLDLMNHVSGYPDYYPLDFVDRRMLAPIAPDALIAGTPVRRSTSSRGRAGRIPTPASCCSAGILEKASGRAARVVSPRKNLHAAQHDPHPLRAAPDERRVAPGYTSFALTKLTRAAQEGDGWLGAAGPSIQGRRHLAAGTSR